MQATPSTDEPNTPALVIDGSGSSVFVGVLGQDQCWLAISQQDGAALESLFPAVEAALKTAQLSLT